jgi:hypothetical protein
VALQWLVPLSAVGALALIVPLLIHLFSRRPPDVLPFPSLQLLRASELRPTRRARLADIALLMLRMAVLAVVVLALMQPAWLNAGAESSGQPSVLVLRDTMALRPGESANALATADDAEGRTTTWLLASTQLREGLQSAVAWLRTRPAPRVLDVHSTFPVWALDSADIRALPTDITVRLTAQLPDSGSASRQAMRATQPADSLPWLPGDSAAAWWNELAFWHVAADGDIAAAWRYRAPLDSVRAAWPVLFNTDGQPVVAAVRNSGGLGLSDATLAEAMVPLQRLARFAAPVPQDTRYHSAGSLASWAAQLSGEALGAPQSTDVHEQRTLARWLWGLAFLLLMMEQLVRRRIRA